MKKWAKFFFLLVIISFLPGCSRRSSGQTVASSTVTQIQIRCETCQSLTQRFYTAPEKIRAVLLCIRKLGPDFPAGNDVDALPGKTLSITLYCADGSRVCYRLRNNLYLQKNNGTWRQINGQNAAGFYQFLLQMDSDPSTGASWSPIADRTCPEIRKCSASRDLGQQTKKFNFFQKRY